MILWLLPLCVFLVLFIFFTWFGAKFGYEEFVENLGDAFMFSLIPTALAFLIPLGIALSSSRGIYEGVEITEICSINRENLTEGSFFIGSGSINDVAYFFYYVKDGADTYHLSKIIAEDTTIIENSQLVPGIYKDRMLKVYPKWSGLGENEYTKNIRIVVPKGTIIKEFSLK